MALYRIDVPKPRHIIILRNQLDTPVVYTAEDGVFEIDADIEPGTRFGPVVVLERLS